MSSAPSLAAHRAAAARAWSATGPVLVAGGLALPIAGTDQFHDFHPHPDFVYLAGTAAPGAVLAFDPREGWTLFAHVPGQDERVWTGDGEPLQSLADRAGLPALPAPALGAWLERRRGEPLAVLGNHDLLHRAAEYELEAWPALEAAVDSEAGERCTEALAELRRTKDTTELVSMRAAARSSEAAHFWALRHARPGMTERALQIELEAEMFRNGGDRTAYGSIVGSGSNAAILHGSPGPRMLADRDLVLIDAGAEHAGYASDVTRTFPVSVRFEGAQRDLYALTLAVQERAIANARPGQEYRELHLAACEQVAAGLVDLGILRGNASDLVDRDAHALFFPHGLGHMLGLATHDAGGCLAGRTRSDRFGLKWLRADLPLAPGYVVTVEPGIYFIPALLDDPEIRRRYSDAVDWDRVEAVRAVGGIRIEDDVLITDGAPDVLSAAIPKSISAIETLRAEAMAR